MQARIRARAELARRHSAKSTILGFTTYTKPDYRVGRHHELLAAKLEAVERGDIKRLMVFMPPRHGKSELSTVRFPAWYLGRNPKNQIITASYGGGLSQKFGRDVRNLVDSKPYSRIFPDVTLAEDSKARSLWHTNSGGVYAAAGVDGTLTGMGANVAILDDPIKDRAEAESLVIRDRAWDWYRSVLRTRLMPNGAIVLIMTRWHQDDPAGRLLDEMRANTGEQWEVLSIPAIAKVPSNDPDNFVLPDPLGRQPGEALWPESYDLQALHDIEASIGSREWASLYQQDPRPMGGTLFKTSLIEVIDAEPHGSQIARAWDLGATAQVGTKDPDWTVGLRLLKTLTGRYVIGHIVRDRGGPDMVEKMIKNTADQDGGRVRIGLPQDPGQAGKSQVLRLTRMLRGFRVESSPETGDKATRAAGVAAQCNVGNLAIVKGTWNRAFLDELQDFPAGVKDDQVDALSRAFDMVSKTSMIQRFRAMST